jgi:hypothetical protein
MITTSITRMIFVDKETKTLFSNRALTIPLLCRKHDCGALISSAKEIYCATGHPLIIDFLYEIMEGCRKGSNDNNKCVV